MKDLFKTDLSRIFFVVGVAIVLLWFKNSVLYLSSVAFIPLFAEKILKIWKNHRSKQRDEEIYLQFLDKIILKMQNGNSFRSSLQDLRDESDAFVQQHDYWLAQFVSFSTQKIKFTSDKHKKIYDDFTYIDKKSHLALNHLRVLRKNLHLILYFRRKSGHLSFQARFQSFFVLGIYFVIVFLQVQFLGFTKVKPYLLLSAPLLLTGFLLTQRLGRRIKWKL